MSACLPTLFFLFSLCRFRERLEPFKAHLPEAAEKVIEEELEKLQVGYRRGSCSC